MDSEQKLILFPLSIFRFASVFLAVIPVFNEKQDNYLLKEAIKYKAFNGSVDKAI